ncbi:MAG: MFS transporter [Kiloniellales bacterium]|nr:MFS transporter [Kiloniellales bacterium]
MSPDRTNWAAVAFGLSLAWFAAFQMFKLPPVLPLLLETYGYDLVLAGGFMSVYAVAGLLLSFGFGRRIERSGWHRPLLGALGVLACGNLLGLVWPHSGWALLVARALEGTGFAVLAIVGPTLANRQAAARHLPIVIGATASWIPVGQLVAVLLAPVALALQGWQSLWVLSLLGCLAFAAWSRRVPGDAAAPGTAAPGTPPSRALSRCSRRILVLTAGLFCLWSAQYFAFMTWLPEYLVAAHGLGLEAALAGYSVPVGCLILFNLVAGVLLRIGVSLGFLLVASLTLQVAVWWLSALGLEGWSGLATLVVYGIGAGVTPVCLFAMPSRAAGQGRAAASAFGIIMTGRNIGVLIGPILLAEALRASGTWEPAAPIFGTVTAFALLTGAYLASKLAAARRATAGSDQAIR